MAEMNKDQIEEMLIYLEKIAEDLGAQRRAAIALESIAKDVKSIAASLSYIAGAN